MNEPEIHPSLSKDNSNIQPPISTDESATVLETPPADVELLLVRDADIEVESCHFWITSYKYGKIKPLEISTRPKNSEILNAACAEGIDEHGNIMVADTSTQIAKYFYFIELPKDEFRERAMWISSIAHVIQSWHHDAIGFHFDSHKQSLKELEELLCQVLRSVHELKNAGNVKQTLKVHLIIRDIDANALLNMALRIKTDLEADSMTVSVYH